MIILTALGAISLLVAVVATVRATIMDGYRRTPLRNRSIMR
jgi:hypothetical protein